MTTDEIRELGNKVHDLDYALRQLRASVAGLSDVFASQEGVFQLDARVAVLEKKLDKLSQPPNVARLL